MIKKIDYTKSNIHNLSLNKSTAMTNHPPETHSLTLFVYLYVNILNKYNNLILTIWCPLGVGFDTITLESYYIRHRYDNHKYWTITIEYCEYTSNHFFFY